MDNIMDTKPENRCPANTTNHIYLAGGITLAAMYIVIICLNSLILFVIFWVKHRTLRWSLDYLVSFLAITDMISTAVAYPIPIIAYLQGYWPGSCETNTGHRLSTFNLTCKQFYLFVTWGRLSTMFIICLMCTERFLAIIKPFVHRDLVTAGRLRRVVYGIWTGTFIYCFLPVLGFGSVDIHFNEHIDTDNATSSPYFFCFIDYEHFTAEGSAREIMDMIYAILFVLMGVITLTIVLFCVCVICRMLLVRRPNLTKTITKSSTRHQSIRSPNEKKANGSICDSTKAKKSNSILGRSKTFIEKRKKEHVRTVVDVKVSKIHIVTDRQNNRKNDRQFSLIPPDTDKETGTLWKKLKKVADKYEPEELQFILLMLIIAALFYITFLPTMVLVFTSIFHIQMGDQYTFWAMRLTSFVTITNPLIYGTSNKLYRTGCCWVFKSIWAAFSCKKIPIPERLVRRMDEGSSSLGPRKMSTNSLAQQHYSHSLTTAERNAQAFIIAASKKKDVAIAKTFIGKMKVGVEGENDSDFDNMFHLETLDEGEMGFEGESFVARNEGVGEEGLVLYSTSVETNVESVED